MSGSFWQGWGLRGRCTMGMFLLGDPWSSFQSQQRLGRPCACLCSNAQSVRPPKRETETERMACTEILWHLSEMLEICCVRQTRWKDATCQQISFSRSTAEKEPLQPLQWTFRNHMWPQVHYSITLNDREISKTHGMYVQQRDFQKYAERS